MFERLPLELREHIYTLHIENCTWIVGEDRIPYAHHNQLQHFVPHKSALLTVNRRISAEFGEQLSRHTRTARLYFEFFDASVQCERESFSHVWREHDTTLSVMRGVRRVELIVRTDSEFRREVGDAVVDGVFDMLNYFKKVEQIYISVESDYEEEFDEDIEDIRATERAKKAREHVQTMIEKTRKMETPKEFLVGWLYQGAERESSRQCRKDLQSEWQVLDNDFERLTLPHWVRWEFVYCQECHGFRTEKERRGFVPGCGHWLIVKQ